VDIRIAKKLAEKLNFNLNIVNIQPEVGQKFREIFYLNNCLAHEKLIAVFFEVYNRKWDNTHVVTGAMANGLARVFFRIPKGFKRTGKNVAALAGYSKNKYIVNTLNDWIENVKSTCDTFNIDIMDIYQWEQDNTHWASLTASEQDIVREEIRPVNNRKLIELFWSLDTRYRFQNHPEIYKRIIKILWNDALLIPCNPSKRSWMFKLLRILGIEQQIYYWHKKRQFLRELK
jgi:hypothetical protein